MTTTWLRRRQECRSTSAVARALFVVSCCGTTESTRSNSWTAWKKWDHRISHGSNNMQLLRRAGRRSEAPSDASATVGLVLPLELLKAGVRFTCATGSTRSLGLAVVIVTVSQRLACESSGRSTAGATRARQRVNSPAPAADKANGSGQRRTVTVYPSRRGSGQFADH